MMGGDPTNIASVSGTQLTENYLSLTSNGTENNQTNSVVFLFDNAFNTIGSSGSQFVNTKPDVAYVDPDTNQLVVTYSSPTSTNVTGTAPYNPFIVVDRDRGKEVHLAGEEPTDLADNSLFGTWIDDSNPATGKWYQTANNLPWAIDLPVSFDYPVEQVEILNAYNHFREWAESGGSVYTDWYEDNTGYRVSENIYTPPSSK
jgi:LruC domain-containing protein